MPIDPKEIDALLQNAVRARQSFPRKDPALGELDPNSLQVLLYLAIDPNESTSSIASDLALQQGTVATAIRRLEDTGYLTQAPSDQGGHLRTRQLTTEGKRMVTKVVKRARKEIGE